MSWLASFMRREHWLTLAPWDWAEQHLHHQSRQLLAEVFTAGSAPRCWSTATRRAVLAAHRSSAQIQTAIGRPRSMQPGEYGLGFSAEYFDASKAAACRFGSSHQPVVHHRQLEPPQRWLPLHCKQQLHWATLCSLSGISAQSRPCLSARQTRPAHRPCTARI